jgi:hypothetical protein
MFKFFASEPKLLSVFDNYVSLILVKLQRLQDVRKLLTLHGTASYRCPKVFSLFGMFFQKDHVNKALPSPEENQYTI